MKTHNSSNPPSELQRGLPFPVSHGAAPPATLQSAMGLLSRGWNWMRSRQLARSGASRLQVTSTVSLGEKRFVAVIQIDGTQFLVGGGAGNVALLAQLNAKEPFENVLKETMILPVKQPAKRAKKQVDQAKVERTRRRA